MYVPANVLTLAWIAGVGFGIGLRMPRLHFLQAGPPRRLRRTQGDRQGPCDCILGPGGEAAEARGRCDKTQQTRGVWLAFSNYGFILVPFVLYFISATAQTKFVLTTRW